MPAGPAPSPTPAPPTAINPRAAASPRLATPKSQPATNPAPPKPAAGSNTPPPAGKTTAASQTPCRTHPAPTTRAPPSRRPIHKNALTRNPTRVTTATSDPTKPSNTAGLKVADTTAVAVAVAVANHRPNNNPNRSRHTPCALRRHQHTAYACQPLAASPPANGKDCTRRLPLFSSLSAPGGPLNPRIPPCLIDARDPNRSTSPAPSTPNRPNVSQEAESEFATDNPAARGSFRTPNLRPFIRAIRDIRGQLSAISANANRMERPAWNTSLDNRNCTGGELRPQPKQRSLRAEHAESYPQPRTMLRVHHC